MHTILVIEDNIQLLDMMALNFELSGYNVIKAITGAEGIRKIRDEVPDLVTLDIGLPDMNGLELIKQIRSWYYNPIIMATAIGNSDSIVESIKLGADDYIIKPFRLELLLEKVNKILNEREEDSNKSVFRSGNLTIDYSTRTVKIHEQALILTKKEYHVLKLLSINSSKPLDFEFILEEIWGHKFITNFDYVRIIIRSLRKKIAEISTDYEFITSVHGFGYQFEKFPAE